jgi:DNA-directed RNA polymerase specialized sigma24 family protein
MVRTAWLLTGSRAAAEDLVQVDLAHGVRLALAALTPRQRAVLVLRFYDDLTEAQTAVVLGSTVGTVSPG